MYGKLGVLETDGERVRCHICGKSYKNLAIHAARTHGFNSDEYKEQFELNSSQSLVAPESRKKYRAASIEMLRRYAPIGQAILIAKNKGKENPGGFKRRFQTVLKRREVVKRPDFLAKMKKAVEGGDHPIHSEEAKRRNIAAHRTDKYRAIASVHGRTFGFGNPALQKRAEEKAWSPEIRKKRESNKAFKKMEH